MRVRPEPRRKRKIVHVQLESGTGIVFTEIERSNQLVLESGSMN
jgi:hypothetical protein